MHQVNKIIDHKIVIGKTFLLPHGKEGEVIRAQVKTRAAQLYQGQEMYLVSLVKVQATDIMTYDAITKGLYMKLQRRSELKDK